MILHYGDVSKLKGLDWVLLELSSEKTIQSIMRRVGKQIPFIFRNEPVELFLPVFNRDLDVFEMRTGNYVFARSTSFHHLLRLKTITGVVGLVTEGESNRPSKAIKVSDNYVQDIIREAEEQFHARAVGIEVGSFVRLLDGETRDYCGHVESIVDGVAVVRIDLKTKRLLIETPIRNLANHPDVPANLRTFYYGPLIQELTRDLGEEGFQMIAEDLGYVEEDITPTPDEQPATVSEETRHSRQKTVTALVKRLVFEGMNEPLPIARKVIAAIKAREVKAPKNLFIAYCIIKNSLMEHYFTPKDSSVKNYRDVIHKYGRQYKFSANDIADIDPQLGIPVSTVEVCKDGRSREARLLKRQTT